VAVVSLISVLVFFPTPALSGGKQCTNTDNCTTDASVHELFQNGAISSGCAELPYFGRTCFEYDERIDDGFLDVNGRRKLFSELVPSFKKPQLCLDDDSLLNWLEGLPFMSNYTQIIQDIKEVVGCIPSGLIELCIGREDKCFEITLQLLYFEQWCAYKGVFKFGCKHK